MSDAKFTIGIDFRGKDELNDVLQKLLRKYDIDASVNIGKIDADIEKHIVNPMRRAKAQFAEWGLVINGIKSSMQTVGMAYEKTIGAMVREAQNAENADIALKGSFRATGLEVENNAQKMSQYAAQLQKTTIYEDDMLKLQMAQMQNIGRFDNTETLMGATKAAIGLSAAFGLDLATAMDLVGKAGAGNTAMLGRYGIVLEETASQAEKMSQLIGLGTGYFKLAEDQAMTSTGSVQQLQNAWGDLQEVLAEGVLPVITKLNSALKPLVEFASSMGSDQRAMTMGLIILNALVVKHTLAVMGQRAAFAALSVEQQHQVMSLMLLIGAQTGGTASSLSFSLGMRSLGASFMAAGNAVKGFLSSIGLVGWIIIGISAAYAVLNKVLKTNTEVLKDKYNIERDSLEQKKEEIFKSQEEEKITLRLTERYQQLASQAKRSKVEQQELKGIHDKLAEKYPGLISATGNYKNSLEGVKGAAEQAKKALADLNKQQWQTELSLVKNNIDTNRIDAYESLAKEFSPWRDIAATKSRIDALNSVYGVMHTLLSSNSSMLSEDKVNGLITQLETWGKDKDKYNSKELNQLQRATIQVRMWYEARKKYNSLLNEGIPKEVESKSTKTTPDKTPDSQVEKETIQKRVDNFRIMQEAGFDAEQVDKASRKKQYEEDLKLVEGIQNSARVKKLLLDEYNADVAKIEEQYRTAREDKEKQHYEQLKFMDSGYYEWKKGQLDAESKKLFPENEGDRKTWLNTQTRDLEKEKTNWDNKPYLDFESEYEATMGHLSELQQLGLITYGEIAKAAWDYYEVLKAITEKNGAITSDEQEMLEKYRKRAQKAQLSVNRDSDIASYYNQVKFLDAGYYEWKKERIKEDVELMQLSEEQKTVILKQKMTELNDERNSGDVTMSFRGKLMSTLGIDASDQDAIVGQYTQIAGQISAIWGQLYSNMESSKNNAIKKLEDRAKAERRSEAWLSAEKEKINAEYEKKVRTMRRIEQKVQIASAMMNTAEGVTNALTLKPAWYAVPAAVAIGVLGAAQVGLIASQKFAEGGSPGLYRGKGTTTSDSNIIAISDKEYIISAERVKKFGLPFFDALNFGDTEKVRKALGNIKMSGVAYAAPKVVNNSYSGGGEVRSTPMQNRELHVVLKCDSRVLARAVARGNKQLLTLG